MKIFVINLDKDVHKMESINAQLKRLHLDYERVPGVYGKSLSSDEFHNVFNAFRWWCAIGRPIAHAEVGCALSHYGIYRKIRQGESVCILEDDVILSNDFSARLEEVEKFVDVGRSQVIMLSSHKKERIGTGIVRSKDAICTDGYVITKPAAMALLAANLPMVVPCDHWGRWEKKGLIELYHLLPIIVRQNQDVFGTSTQAHVIPVSKYSLPRWCWHKSKRLVGKTIDTILQKVCK